MDPGPAQPLKIAAILLSAGFSTRMGDRNKLLIEIDGEPLVRRTARTYLAAGADVYAVIGHESDAIRAALADLRVSFIENPRYVEGQDSSVRAGIDALPRGYDAVLMALADQAALTPADIRDLLRAFAEGDRGLVLIPYHEGKRGNPALFPAQIIEEIRTLGPEATCRKFINANPARTRRYETASDRFTFDVDTPADLEAFRITLHRAGCD